MNAISPKDYSFFFFWYFLSSFLVFSSKSIFSGSYLSCMYSSEIYWPNNILWLCSFFLKAKINGKAYAVAKSSSYIKVTNATKSLCLIFILTSLTLISFNSLENSPCISLHIFVKLELFYRLRISYNLPCINFDYLALRFTDWFVAIFLTLGAAFWLLLWISLFID